MDAPRTTPSQPKRPGPSAAGTYGLPVSQVDELQAEGDEQQDDRHLDRHDDRIDECRARDTAIAQHGDRSDDRHRRQVDDDPVATSLPSTTSSGAAASTAGSPISVPTMPANRPQQTVKVCGPPHSDRGGGEQVFEHQHPADQPGGEFAESRIRTLSRRCPQLAASRRTRHSRVPRSRLQCRPEQAERDCGPGMIRSGLAVSTKMPAPITAPMPSSSRCLAVRTRLRPAAPCRSIGRNARERFGDEQTHAIGTRSAGRSSLSAVRMRGQCAFGNGCDEVNPLQGRQRSL